MQIAPDGTAYDLTRPTDAPVVVLIHGLGLNRAVWQWMVPDLAPRFRVLAYDLFGHGDSPAPPQTPICACCRIGWRVCWAVFPSPQPPLSGFRWAE